MAEEPFDPAADTIERLLVDGLEADAPTEALERICSAHPEHAAALRRRFALAREMGLVAGPGTATPEQLGDYRLIRELGRGGMGVVWLAEQLSLGREVALKLLRPGFGTEGFARRLRHEASILGKLRHVGIAQIYEAGAAVAAEGHEQPFFAMEYVEGLELDVYAQEHELGTAERLALVALVADAVAHAHSLGVIHRDLKPDNVLVDGRGQPKILDFGVARVTESDVATVTMQTATGQVLGTVPYMSPEQVNGDSRAIDARTDVYALGVILYELLAGQVPFDVRGKSIAEAARLICEKDPSRLGTIDTRYRGAVETIVGKALAKEKERRYRSVAELAADIRRFLRNEPIDAQPASTLYQLRKLASRHRGLVAGAVATMLVLAAGTIVSTIFAIRADRNAVLAADRRELAERQAYAVTLGAAESSLRASDVLAAGRQLAAAPVDRRGWEWAHLFSRLDDSVRVLDAPDGQSFELSSVPGQAAYRVTIHGPGGTRYARFDPWSGDWTADSDPSAGAAAEWWVGRDFVERGVPTAEATHVVHVSDDRQRVVIWSGRPRGDRTFWLVERPEAAPARQLPLAPDTLRTVRVSDSKLAAATQVRAVVLSLDEGFGITPLEGHDDTIVNLAADPVSGNIAIGYLDGELRLYGDRGRLLASDSSHHQRIYQICFHDDGRTLATIAWDGTVRLFDGRDLRPLRVQRGHPEVRLTRLEVAGDGSSLATRGYGDALQWRFWDARPEDPRVLRGHSSYVYPVAFAPSGKWLASGGWRGADAGEVLFWDLEQRVARKLPLVTNTGNVCALAISSDGRRLATLDRERRVRVWDLDQHRLIVERPDYPGHAYGPLTLHPDSSRMLWPAGRSMQVWNIDEDRLLEATPDFLRELRTGHAAPDGTMIAVYSEGRLRCYDTTTGAETAALSIGGGYRPFVFFRDAHNRLRLSFPIAAAPDATREHFPRESPGVARVPRAVAVVDPWTGRRRATLRGHSGEVLALAVSPDGTRIVTGGRDAVVRVWDTETFDELVALGGHDDYVFSLAWSPDGSTLASGSGDGSVRVWDTRPMTEIVAAARGTRPGGK